MKAGDKVQFFSPNTGTVEATVLRDRRGKTWDLGVPGVPFSETQMVPEGPTPDVHGRHCWELHLMPVPPEVIEAQPHILVPRPPPPLWPAIAALAMSTIAAGLSILSLLTR